MTTKPKHTIDDLYYVEGKAELVNGEIVHMAPTGFLPGRAGGVIYASLLEHERHTKDGYALPDNLGFKINLSHREFFSPDAAWYTGTVVSQEDFLEGAPAFAVEVRSKSDYGPQAEREIAKKIADYFAAGTLVVWDADVLRGQFIKKYNRDDPNNPVIFRRGDVADAQPAVPGWTMRVDELFI